MALKTRPAFLALVLATASCHHPPAAEGAAIGQATDTIAGAASGEQAKDSAATEEVGLKASALGELGCAEDME